MIGLVTLGMLVENIKMFMPGRNHRSEFRHAAREAKSIFFHNMTRYYSLG